MGGIDVLVNNASAISLTGTLDTPMKRFDLMHQVNTRGTFLCTQKCLPHLKRAANPHVLNISPPLNLDPRWFAPHVAYTMSKYGMSLCVLGMAEEFRADGIAFNALWPRTAIDTAAIAYLGGPAIASRCRTPGHRRRRGARHPHARLAAVHRQFLHRRRGAAAPGSPISPNTGRKAPPRPIWCRIFSCDTFCDVGLTGLRNRARFHRVP